MDRMSDTSFLTTYKTLFRKLRVIVSTSKDTPRLITKSQLNALQREIAKELNQIQPGSLEKHLYEKSLL